MSLRVDDFKAKLKGGGARPNLFRATVNFPAYAGGDVEITSFLCKAAQLPASIMAVIEVPFRGRQLKLAGDRTFEPWTVTILNDTDFGTRNAMADLIVDQLDKDGSVLKTYNFRGCFPTNVAAIDVSYESNDAIEEYTVEFQVQYWESDTTS
jgi:hypothetical protein